jgi:hypothetical protein
MRGQVEHLCSQLLTLNVKLSTFTSEQTIVLSEPQNIQHPALSPLAEGRALQARRG